MHTRRHFSLGAAAFAALPSLALSQVGAGADIRIGTTCPLSGPAAFFGPVGTAMEACFEMINDAGGVGGRKLKLLIADDAYTPNRTLEQTRKLVEAEKVLFMLGQVGTVTALAARQYLNDARIPQLLVASGAPTWLEDINRFPWSLAAAPSYVDEGRSIAEHILATRPNAKVGILFQNDDSGRGFMRGVREVLARRPGALAMEQTTEPTDPAVDSQVIALQSSGADVVVCICLPRSASQAIRRIADMNWPAQIYLSSTAASIQQTLAPAGLDRAKGVLSGAYLKEASDATWAADAGMKSTVDMMKKYKPRVAIEFPAALGATIGMLAVEIIRQCGRDVSRENILAQTMKLDVTPPLLLPGLSVKTSPEKRAILSKLRFQRFDGAAWKLLPA